MTNLRFNKHKVGAARAANTPICKQKGEEASLDTSWASPYHHYAITCTITVKGGKKKKKSGGETRERRERERDKRERRV